MVTITNTSISSSGRSDTRVFVGNVYHTLGAIVRTLGPPDPPTNVCEQAFPISGHGWAESLNLLPLDSSQPGSTLYRDDEFECG